MLRVICEARHGNGVPIGRTFRYRRAAFPAGSTAGLQRHCIADLHIQARRKVRGKSGLVIAVRRFPPDNVQWLARCAPWVLQKYNCTCFPVMGYCCRTACNGSNARDPFHFSDLIQVDI